GNPQSYNRYSYCVNDPLRYNDPSGLDFVATSADLRYGYIPGPYAYKSSSSTLGGIGATLYNPIPELANSIYQASRPVAAVNDAAGDVLEAGTQAVTGDPQLAKNSRNLTLLVGLGEVGTFVKVEKSFLK